MPVPNPCRLRSVVPVLFCATVILGLPTAQAQEETGAGNEADHDALRAMRTVFEKAVADNDLSLLEPHLHPEFSGVMVTGEMVNSFQEVEEYWQKIHDLMGDGGTYEMELIPELSVIKGDFAFAKGSTADKVQTGGGKVYEFTSNWTAALRKLDGEWKILRMQGTMNPVDNSFVRATAGAAATFAGITAGVVGLVVGFLIRWVLGRKKSA